MSRKLARLGDQRLCPPHLSAASIESGATFVLAGGSVAARLSDTTACPGFPDAISSGAATVLIEGLPACRVGDGALHGGVVLEGTGEVLVGGPSFAVPDNIQVLGPAEFLQHVVRDLYAISQTPTGYALLASIRERGRRVTILQAPSNDTVAFDRALAFKHPSSGKPGEGTDSIIYYNDTNTKIGEEPWQTRPPAIGLAHELVHAEQNAGGLIDVGIDDNDGKPDPTAAWLKDKAAVRELEAAGIPEHDKYPFNENKIRSEWSPKQPIRRWY